MPSCFILLRLFGIAQVGVFVLDCFQKEIKQRDLKVTQVMCFELTSKSLKTLMTYGLLYLCCEILKICVNIHITPWSFYHIEMCFVVVHNTIVVHERILVLGCFNKIKNPQQERKKEAKKERIRSSSIFYTYIYIFIYNIILSFFILLSFFLNRVKYTKPFFQV